MSPEKREPFFFGDDRRLYGCLHHAGAGGRRQSAVLIAQPIAHEYMRAHRSLLLLASRLVRADFPVLRFDYSSTGDSAGTEEQARWDDWIADLGAAVAELRRRTRLQHVAVVGMRLGATLAALHGRRAGDIETMALWDPIVDGTSFVDGLAASHAAMLDHEYVDPGRVVQTDDAVERHGHLWGRDLLAAIGEVALDAEPPPAARTLVLTEQADPAADRLGGERQVVEGPKIWSEEPFRGLVPQAQVEALVDWLSQVTS